MVCCGITPGKTGNIQPQDEAVYLAAINLSPVVPVEEGEGDEDTTSPFEHLSGVVMDHSYLPTSFGHLTEKCTGLYCRFLWSDE